MNGGYLFVHFREKTTPDGEQVHFALSRDGYHWQAVNHGQPVLWAYYGDCGSRDMTVTRDERTGLYHIFATDLSLSYGMRKQYRKSWEEISRNGSKCLSHWQSADLCHWTEQALIPLADEQFGCVWAPDLIYDAAQDAYLLHWSSSHAGNGYTDKAIYYSLTRDFVTYTPPQVLFAIPGCSVIDSAMYVENGVYYLFIKNETNPKRIQLYSAPTPTGPFTEVTAFRGEMEKLAQGQYEAPTAVQLHGENGVAGPWCLYLDYYGEQGDKQGYVPFVADSLQAGVFRRADAAFRFPYGFKHGTILRLDEAEYARVAAFDYAAFDAVPDNRM